MRPKIVRGVDGSRFALHTEFNEDFKDELKDLVPRNAREWDDTQTRWLIDEEYEENVAKLVVVHFESCEIFGEDGDQVDYVQDRSGRTIQERLL